MRKIIFLAQVILLCMSLMACGGNGDGGSDAIPESIKNLVIDDSVEYDYSNFFGTWLGEDGSVLIMEHIEDITNGERFMLSDANDELLASGNIQYVEKYDHVYAYNERDGIAHRCWFDEDNALCVDSFGTFSKANGNTIPVLMGGALPFTNMETLQSENYEDGTYYYADVAEDGQVTVVSTVYQSHWGLFDETFEDYMIDCALTLEESNIYELQSVEENATYSENLSYPVYLVTYTSGENEDSHEWTVFVVNTDGYTYLYGFCATLDAADDMESVYQDVFAGLYLSD